MSSTFINGAKYAVSTSLAAAVAVSAISNANPAVATAAAAPSDGDILVLKSGWTEVNETVRRAENIAGSTFELGELDTTNVIRFPAGEGAGAYQIAGDFVGLSQVRNVETSGGEQQFFNYQYVEDVSSQQRQKPTSKNPMTTAITLDYDPTLPWYQTLVDLDFLREPVVLRETLPTGDVVYYYGYISFNGVPTKTLNENMTVSATFSLLTNPVRYEA